MTLHTASDANRLPPSQSNPRADRWIERALANTRRSWGRQDVMLGFGLVGAFSILVVATGALSLDGRPYRILVAIAATTVALDVGFVLLSWRRFTRWMLLFFPVLLVLSEVALSLLTKNVAANYTAFFTLAFLYVGLTQPRGVGPGFALLATPAWVIAQQRWTASVGIRLSLTLVVWLLLSEVLADRSARGRATTTRLVAQANTDVLTGLASRLFISDQIERLEKESEASPSSLLFIDLDGFKTVNDTFGHAAGDELLVAVAERLRSTLRVGDVAARLGGDEFATLLVGSTLAQATEVANRMLPVLSGPFPLSRGRVAVTASIGIVEITPPASAKSVLRDADLAMYEAKSSGRNRLSVFEEDMQVRMTRRLELETELRDALECNQFEIHYQPVVNMGTGTTIGAEALLRWRHPRRGLLAPGDFLATSEELGLMEPLGDWILHQACRQAATWQSTDPARAFTIAVNLSGQEIFAVDLKSRVERALASSGLPGALLVLEITERVIMADALLARRRLEELRSLGVRIAIDDFGTGYSSLSYLRELPIDILKIDQSFVAPLGSDHQALALLRSITSIADALLLDVIVEGVETAAQVEILSELGCHIAQGFYFGRPVSADDLSNILAWARGNEDSARASPGFS